MPSTAAKRKESNITRNNCFVVKKLPTKENNFLRIDDIEANQAYAGSGLSVYSISLTICSQELKKYKTHVEIIEALSSLDYIYHIEEMH